MIFNLKIDRLLEMDIVKSFIHRHGMQAKLCINGDDFSFILYKIPYVVEFHDALIENYLEISLSDISAELLMSGGSALQVSIDLGLLNLEQLRKMNFKGHPRNDIFISEGARKMFDLHCDFDAIDKLLALIEAKGGLSSMRDGTFDSRFDFKDYVYPMNFGLKEKYLKCINEIGL